MNPDNTYNVVIALQNSGTAAWNNQFELSYQWEGPNGTINGTTSVSNISLTEGNFTQTTLPVRTPSNSGPYILKIDMVHENGGYFHSREASRSWFTLDYNVCVGTCDTYLPIIMKNYSPPVACQEGGNLIQNAGFESQLGTHWIEVLQPPWAYTFRTYLRNKSGTYSAVLGGLDNSDETLYQPIILPADTVSAKVSFWLYMVTTENDFAEFDKLIWDLKNDSTGYSVLQNAIVHSNKSISEHTWTKVTAEIPGLENLTQQTLRFNFRAITDGSNYTNFWIDDVTFVYTYCQ